MAARHESDHAGLAGELEAARTRWEAEDRARQADREQLQRELADDAERRLAAERERLETELRDREAEHAAGLHQADEERRELRHQLERLGDELRIASDRLEALKAERDEALRQVETIAGEHEHQSAERQDAAQRELDQLRAAHIQDLAELGEEFDALRLERDAAVQRCDEHALHRDRFAALHDEAANERQESERAHQAELDRLAAERVSFRQQAESERRRGDDLAVELQALRAELDELRHERDADQQAYEQALEKLREQHAAASQAVEAARDQATAAPPAVAPAPAETEQRLAEIQSRLQHAETARSVLNDALKSARKQIEDLSAKLDDARLEQDRVRSILDGMGIHLM
jgi:chromosome segregation ATPase